jgi:hypothetical protein
MWETTAKRWYGEILDLFCDVIVQNVFYPRSPEELRQMRTDLTKERFVDLLAAIDATNWPMLKVHVFFLFFFKKNSFLFEGTNTSNTQTSTQKMLHQS